MPSGSPPGPSDGRRIPPVGLGLWKVEPAAAAGLVDAAIGVGYRHLDSACDYANEPQVGEGVRRALDRGACTRDELWVTSKLWNTYHRPEHVRAACERSLADLGLDRLDLYLIHFPISLAFVPFEERYPPQWLHDPAAADPRMLLDPVPIAETWGAMERLVEAGLVREIGVANFTTALLRDMLATASIRPSMLQVELHPYLSQPKLVRFCAERGIGVTGFSPLGAPSYVPLGMAEPEESLLEHEVIRRIAGEQGMTPAQVLLRWGVQRGTAVIPKTSRVERLEENLAAVSLKLTAEQMRAIDALDRGRRFNDPGVFCEGAFGTFCPIFD